MEQRCHSAADESSSVCSGRLRSNRGVVKTLKGIVSVLRGLHGRCISIGRDLTLEGIARLNALDVGSSPITPSFMGK